jgi:hypothetical protein
LRVQVRFVVASATVVAVRVKAPHVWAGRAQHRLAMHWSLLSHDELWSGGASVPVSPAEPDEAPEEEPDEPDEEEDDEEEEEEDDDEPVSPCPMTSSFPCASPPLPDDEPPDESSADPPSSGELELLHPSPARPRPTIPMHPTQRAIGASRAERSMAFS